MAIVWLWFDQVLQIGGRPYGGGATSYTEQQLEYNSSYTEKQMEHKSSYAEKLAV